jgi:hypothetical protein
MENRPAGFSGHDRETLRREALTYLANLPRLLNEQGTQAAGQTALSLGNYLNWIHGLIEAGPYTKRRPAFMRWRSNCRP